MPGNKLIANAFYFAGFVEAWGRGFEIIENAFRDTELEIPTFNEEFSGVAANIKREVFYAIQHGARIDDRTGKVIKAISDTKDVEPTQKTSPENEKPTQKQFGKTAQALIDILVSNPNATRVQIAKQIGKSENSVKLHLSNLQTKCIIERVGPDKGGYWKVLKHRK